MMHAGDLELALILQRNRLGETERVRRLRWLLAAPAEDGG